MQDADVVHQSRDDPAGGGPVEVRQVQPLEAVVASLFIFGAFALLRGRHEEATDGRETEPSFWRVAGAAFAVVAVAEFGDLTQIVTANLETARRFVAQVDAAAVLVNASTRFTDGAEFGFGAEIGISTQKLHARGPMGLPELTSTKWVVYGSGQIR